MYAAATEQPNTTTGSGADRLTHAIHPCGVEPVRTRCGAAPRNPLPPGHQAPKGAVLCGVCADLSNHPCNRCGH